jgi:predicted ATPase/signal transduction histidine kinase
MIKIAGFKILEKIHASQKMAFFTACPISSSKTILIKIANTEAHNHLLETEYQITRNLNSKIVVKPIEIQSCNNIRFLVLEDFEAKPLGIFDTKSMKMQELIGLFIDIARSLSHLHESNIIHNNINPDNLWFNPVANTLKIGGFCLSKKEISQTKDPFQHHTQHQIAQPPGYISPEQTGRTSLDLTRATDFYSLGCTLYKLSTGRLPFVSKDKLELIHCHLAKTPGMPNQINEDIPQPLCDIIMKLLEKNPLDRYQSCSGLQKDFETCMTLMNNKNQNHNFQPGLGDLTSTICFSDKLYGRSRQIKKLTKAMAGKGKTRYPLILVSGEAGVGKSALVEQAWKQLDFKAYFVNGKHEKTHQSRAAQTALESVILQILGEGKTKVKKWKNKIIMALGNTAQPIIDFVPMLEFIIGKHPPAMKLTALESDTRLNNLLCKFIETIASKEQPVIMFLDDMQWVEQESIRILEVIKTHPINGLCIICAYRNQETNEQHPFIRTVNKIKKNKVPVLEINLNPLDMETQNHWVSDLFGKARPDIRPFSTLLFEKTDCNPYFIKSILENLSSTKHLYQTPNRTWDWKFKQISQVPATDNMGNFMIKKITQLSVESIELLKITSCFGSCLSITLMETIYAKENKRFKAALHPLINKGIMIQNQNDLRFVHDIVQESVYSMMSREEQTKLHLSAGRKLLKMTPENEIDNQIFMIADQMNFARSIIGEAQEQLNLARLNLKAGQNKMELSSLEAADTYFKTGISLLPADAWHTNYMLALSLFSQRCEILYVLGKYTQADFQFDQVLNHAEQPDHLLKIFEAKSTYLMQAYQTQEVIDTGLTILSKLGYKISPEFNRFQLIKEVLLFKKQLLGTKVSDIINLPEMIDPRKTAIIRSLIIISRACAINGHPFAHIALFRSMRFILTNGLTPYAGYVFSFYGTVLSNLFYDVKKGYAFGKLSMEIVEKFKAKKQKILTSHLFTVISINCLGQTKHHLEQLSKIVKSSLEAGLFMNIFNLHAMYYFLNFISGTKLEDIEHHMRVSRKEIRESSQILWIHNLELLFQVVRVLRGNTRKLFLLDTPLDIYDEKFFQQWENANIIPTISDYFLYHQIVSYVLQDGKKSLEYAKKGALYFKSYVSLSSQMTHLFFYSLTLLERCNGSNPGAHSLYLGQARQNQKFFKKIFKRAPENNPHMFFLLEAEIARVKNQFERAACYYDRAMSSAKDSGYLHVEAISCELAAKFFLNKKQGYLARSLFLKAKRLYREWGVIPKVRQLETQYALILKEDRTDKIRINDTVESNDVDIYSVLKASHIIAREIKPKKLMRLLIQLILKNSGAQRAFLLLYSDNQLKIEAFAQTHSDFVKVLQGVQVEQAGQMLASAIAYSSFLSKKSIILDNASLDKQFNYDPYIIENKPLSILCTPIIGKKNIQGVLYLENNLMMGAFTKQRLKILDILNTQVVISIENSRLYEKLRTQIKKQMVSTRKIQSHQAQLRRMSSQLAQTEERERKAIADDLHDSVTQTLALGVSMINSIHHLDDKENFLKLEETQALLKQALANIRSLTFQLSSPILYDVGLEPALEWLCEDFFQKHGLHIQFVHPAGRITPFDETTKITLYRAVRELIINIIKHAHTQDAALSVSARDGYFNICMEDKGVGFNTAPTIKHDGFGLFSISERMRALKGKIHILSTPGKGTRITIEVPVPMPLKK